jgi:flagellar M-ring protein FliF
MHYLSSLEQILGNLKGLGARRLAILGIVFALVFAVVGGGSYLLTRSSFETIYSGLSAQDVTRISKVLSESGIPFEVGLDGSRISVSRGSGPQVRAMLAERGLPSSSASGYELFDKIGPMGLTSFMQDMTRVRALEGEIARTIQGMRGVKSARVHIVLPEPQTLRRSPQSASASVVIKTDTSNDASAVPAIRHLVAAAAPGLATGNVRVLSVDGAVLAADGEEGDNSPGKLLDLQRVVSKGLQNNIRQALAPYLGVGHFEVSVAVRLNVDNRVTKEVTYDPEGKVERSTRVVRETSSSQNAKGGAQTVTVEQVIPTEGAKSEGNDQSKRAMQKRDETTSYEIGSRSTATTSAGYRIENVTAAVVLDRKRIMSLLGTGANSEALLKQVAEIEQVVSAAAGIDSKRGDRVTVAALEFADAATTEPAAGPGILDRLMGHMDTFIKALALLGTTFALILFGLKPLIRAITTSLEQNPPMAVSAAGPAVSLNAESSEPLARAPSLSSGDLSGSPRMIPETPSRRPDEPRERLQRMVQSDQEQAVAVLKQWVREGHEQ